MSDITSVLSAIHTLTDERKEYLMRKFEEGTLSSAEKAELQEHILRAMERVSIEVEHARGILQNTSSDGPVCRR